MLRTERVDAPPDSDRAGVVAAGESGRESCKDRVATKLADARQNHPELLKPDSEFLRDLLPDRWAQSHPNSVQVARIDERQQTADRKRLRRATKRQRDREAARAAAAN